MRVPKHLDRFQGVARLHFITLISGHVSAIVSHTRIQLLWFHKLFRCFASLPHIHTHTQTPITVKTETKTLHYWYCSAFLRSTHYKWYLDRIQEVFFFFKKPEFTAKQSFIIILESIQAFWTFRRKQQEKLRIQFVTLKSECVIKGFSLVLIKLHYVFFAGLLPKERMKKKSCS